MCGRFTLYSSPQELQDEFGLPIPDYEPSYNIAPTQQVLAFVANNEETKAGFLHWGLIPFWAKEKKIGSKMINARAETIDEKPAFKNLLKRKRCLIPANSFYEWKREDDSKHPFIIHLTNSKLLTFAGLWDRWIDPATNNTISSCTIITTSPNDFMSSLHDRMPVILDEGNRQAWLDPSIDDPAQIKSMLLPYNRTHMTAHEVSKAVNNPRNNGAHLIHQL
ncbi:SOS response-associated peptidase [Shouchella patagoniensis]|uniref:SOS response-associated peptidase n=1 Tax=Shouchella patagoniensis TaxID=228576 RepID=UPI000995A303|nr:SOS response-associated peptidase [Shouchella patagoniensis]